MQNKIVFLKNVSIEEKKRVLDFVDQWQNDELELELLTSGSTGQPKKINILKASMLASAKATGEFFGFQKGQSNLIALSSDYIAGKMQIVRSLVFEMDLIIASTTANPLELIEDIHIDFAAFVPLQVRAILADDKTKAKYESIRNVIIGGAPIGVGLYQDLCSMSNNSFASFGMTETVSHIALKNINCNNDRYIAMPNVSFELSANGCLIVRAPRISDKPFYTNDRVELINNFEFKWLGRKDFIINSGGVKIQPEIVEEKIYGLISNPFYISKLTDDKLGEKVVLYIEGEQQGEISISKLKNDISTLVSKFEVPKLIIYKPFFLRTKTGKIIRQ